LAVDHVDRAGVTAAVGVGGDRADGDVVDAVAVEVAGAADGQARGVVRVDSFDVHAAGTDAAVDLHVAGVGGLRAVDDVGRADVGETAVDVAGTGDGTSDLIACALPVDPQPAGFVRVPGVDDVEIHVGGVGGLLAVDDVRRAGPEAEAEGVDGADDHVVDAIGVDVAGGGECVAGAVVGLAAGDEHRARVLGGAELDEIQVDVGRVGRLLPVDDVGRARARPEVGIRERRPDEQVADAVAVDVPGGGNRPAGQVAVHAGDLKPGAGEALQVHVGEVVAAVDDVGRA
jgi:hypothetical protein